MTFEWDPRKARENRRKHRVSFEEAATIFGDPLALTYDDPDHSETERRFITVGTSSTKRILMVSHAERGDATRIISARVTTKRERKQYEESSD